MSDREGLIPKIEKYGTRLPNPVNTVLMAVIQKIVGPRMRMLMDRLL